MVVCITNWKIIQNYCHISKWSLSSFMYSKTVYLNTYGYLECVLFVSLDIKYSFPAKIFYCSLEIYATTTCIYIYAIKLFEFEILCILLFYFQVRIWYIYHNFKYMQVGDSCKCIGIFNNTLRLGQGGHQVGRRHFQIHFLEWKCLNFD